MDKVIPILSGDTEEVIKKDSINPQSNRVVRPNSEFIFWDDMWNKSDENGR